MGRLFARSRSWSGLLGRAKECKLLDDLVSTIRRGESRSLVLHGEAGIGKTALMHYLVTSASDLTVVRAAGVESEMELAYASLHQLCAPFLDRVDSLPVPQREALRVVFGVSEGPVPDRFLVGLAVLSLLADVAERRPLLCLVDDAQWLDQESALTLSFVARRLLAEQVGLVFAARELGDHLQHVTALELGGVPVGEARVLLSSAVRFVLDEGVRDRIIAETRGNPLALLELPRGLTATQLAGGFGLIEAQALTGRIEESFARRLDPLDDATRLLLLLAAAEPVGDPLLLWRAATRLGIAPTAAEAAQVQGLLTIGERVIFRHPLVRSAVYRSARKEDRRAVHLALAEATDRETDPDRRAWHLAASAPGPDEQVALELERSARRAQTRGGLAATAAFLRRACTLTDDPARRIDRTLAAAEATYQAGEFDAALGLLATVDAANLDGFQSARSDLLRGHMAFMSFRASDAPALLLKAGRRLESFDLDLARDAYLTAWGAAHVAGHGKGDGVLLELCSTVQALPRRPSGPRPVDLLLDGLALLITEGHAGATPTLRRAARALADMTVGDIVRWGWIAGAATALLWDVEGMRANAAREVRLLRDAGALAALPSSLSILAVSTVWTGDFAGAASLILETDSVAAATGSLQAPYALLRLRALQGREDAAATAMASAIELAAPGGQGMAAGWAHWTAAVLYNALGRYEEAAAAAQQASSNPLYWWSMWVLPELVEAATRMGDADLARDALERLAATTQPSGADFALGIEARSRALLSVGATADELCREAIERLGRTPLRPELARAYLLYGEWLHSQNRKVEAREQLRKAHEMFVGMGMEAFAERARHQLQASGDKVRTRMRKTRETRDNLTTKERQIALLARDGLSNPEIGARLFVSPRTVEWHLRNVFDKLGTRSRRGLATALTNAESLIDPGPVNPS